MLVDETVLFCASHHAAAVGRDEVRGLRFVPPIEVDGDAGFVPEDELVAPYRVPGWAR